MTDQEKAFLLHIALAAFESVRVVEPERSAKRTRLDRSMDRILEMIDIYRPEAWPNELICRAASVVDDFNERIRNEFGRKP